MKTLIFLILCNIALNNSLIQGSEFDLDIRKENELTNYEEILSKFGNIQAILEKNKITKEDINNIGNNLILSHKSISFIKKTSLIIIIQDISDGTYYVETKLL